MPAAQQTGELWRKLPLTGHDMEYELKDDLSLSIRERAAEAAALIKERRGEAMAESLEAESGIKGVGYDSARGLWFASFSSGGVIVMRRTASAIEVMDWLYRTEAGESMRRAAAAGLAHRAKANNAADARTARPDRCGVHMRNHQHDCRVRAHRLRPG